MTARLAAITPAEGTRRCVIYGTDFTGVGGGEQVMLEHARSLHSRGWRVAIIAPPSRMCEVARATGLDVREVPVPVDRKRLANLTDEIEPDVCHLVSYGPLTRAISQHARRNGMPIVLTVSALEFPSGLRSRRFVKTAAAALVPSKTVLSQLDSRVRCPPVKVLAPIRPGSSSVEPTRKPFQGRDADEVTVGWLGRFDPMKRLEDTIAAFSTLCDQAPGAKLRIAAGMDSFSSVSAEQYRERIVRLVQSLGLADRTAFHETVADVYGFLDDIDVFVNSSERETFSRATYEAMIMGRAIVSTRAAAVTDLITEGCNGLLVEVGDVDGLARSLKVLNRDRAGAVGLGEAARRDALGMAEHCNAESGLEELYTEILSIPRGRFRFTPRHSCARLF
jgi:glycosyltransferase involved in cell wall biosynthesis